MFFFWIFPKVVVIQLFPKILKITFSFYLLWPHVGRQNLLRFTSPNWQRVSGNTPIGSRPATEETGGAGLIWPKSNGRQELLRCAYLSWSMGSVVVVEPWSAPTTRSNKNSRGGNNLLESTYQKYIIIWFPKVVESSYSIPLYNTVQYPVTLRVKYTITNLEFLSTILCTRKHVWCFTVNQGTGSSTEFLQSSNTRVPVDIFWKSRGPEGPNNRDYVEWFT